MKLRNTLVLLACLLGWAFTAQADAPPTIPPTEKSGSPDPPKSPESIWLVAQFSRLSSEQFEDNQTVPMILPPSANLSAPMIRKAIAMGAMEGKILAEPTLVTTNGRPVTFLSGAELSGPTTKRMQPDVKGLDVGTKIEVLPRILHDGRIWMQFHFEQTEAALSGGLPKKSEANEIALASGVLSKGTAIVERGESLVAVLPDPQSKAKTNPKTFLVMALTPEIGEGKLEPVSSSPPPADKPPEITPAIEFQTEPTITLRGDQRGDLFLNDAESGVIVSPETIRQVSGFRSEVIAISALGPRKLKVQAKQVGETEVVITDANSKQYRVFVRVRSKSGPDAVKDVLAELFPKADVKVFALNESLLLRGTVPQEIDLQQITEIAEQYAPKVLNHLTVASSKTQPFRTDPMTAASTLKHQPSRDGEVQQLRQDIQLLHQDVKRILNVLERQANRRRVGSRVPQADSFLPPTATTPYSSNPIPGSAPSYNPNATTPLGPNSPPKLNHATPLPNHTGPSPSLPLPNHSGPNPVQPVPEYSDAIPGRPIPNDNAIPHDPSDRQFRSNPLSTPTPTKPTLVPEQRTVPTEPLSEKRNPSAFVVVRTARISLPNAPIDEALDETLGSGVVVAAEPGRAIVLTAAHLLKNYEPGKFVLQVGARGQSKQISKNTFSGFYPATVILRDDKADVALLRAKVPSGIALSSISLAGHSLPDKQAMVHCVGFVNGPADPKPTRVGDPRMVTRKVAHVNHRYMGSEYFEFDGLVPLGFSGGAVLDSENKLIGIVTAIDPQGKHTVCRTAAELRKLLINVKQIDERTFESKPTPYGSTPSPVVPAI